MILFCRAYKRALDPDQIRTKLKASHQGSIQSVCHPAFASLKKCTLSHKSKRTNPAAHPAHTRTLMHMHTQTIIPSIACLYKGILKRTSCCSLSHILLTRTRILLMHTHTSCSHKSSQAHSSVFQVLTLTACSSLPLKRKECLIHHHRLSARSPSSPSCSCPAFHDTQALVEGHKLLQVGLPALCKVFTRGV